VPRGETIFTPNFDKTKVLEGVKIISSGAPRVFYNGKTKVLIKLKYIIIIVVAIQHLSLPLKTLYCEPVVKVWGNWRSVLPGVRLCAQDSLNKDDQSFVKLFPIVSQEQLRSNSVAKFYCAAKF